MNLFFVAPGLPLARVLDGFNQRYSASDFHSTKQQRRRLTWAMAGIEPMAARFKARTQSIVLCGPR